MKTLRRIGRTVAMVVIATCALLSCSDSDDYFNTPSWIGGSCYEELANDGNYTLFLQGADLSGYTPIINGKSIVTVIAPNDDAMREYLQTNYGTTDITQVPSEELKKLIGFHILYYAFDKQKLTNFRPVEGDGATEEEKLVNAGLYYKFRTHSQDPISVEQNVTDSASYPVSVYHLERYLPVFSYLMFQTKGIDAKTNYEYFYPETGWKDDAGFNIANAGVNEYADIANNGYIYKVDRVVKPLETIYTELKNDSKYSKYLALYDQFSQYQKDDNLTLEYGNGTDLYQHYHNKNNSRLAPIACEWPVTSYTQVAALARQAYSVFAPTNDALDNFFNDYWRLGGYESLDSVASSSIQDLLLNSYTSENIVFPEEITKGLVENPNNDNMPIRFDVNSVAQSDRIMCVNGVLYGLGVLTPPAKYIAVTGPAYQYKKYSSFLNMLSSSGMVSTLSTDAVKYIMLYPDNDQMMANGGYHLETINGNETLVSTESPRGVGSGLKSAYVYAHIAAPVDGNTVLPTSGKKVYRAMTSAFNLYWYVKDGRITTSIRHNELLKYDGNTTTEDDVFSRFEPLAYRGDVNGWSNGNAYSYEKNFFEGNYDQVTNSRFIRTMWSHRLDATTEFYAWINLLDKAGLVNRSAQTIVSSVWTENCLMFVPVTNRLEQAIVDGKIPGVKAGDVAVGEEGFIAACEVTDEAALQAYLKDYFIPLSTATISNYPYIGWGEDTESTGGLVTLNQTSSEQGVQSVNLNIYDDGSKLSVALAGSSHRVDVTPDYDYFPFVFDDGPAHFIDGVLE